MGFQGRQVGRANIATGTTETILTWSDPESTPPSQWTLVVFDAGGGSVPTVTQGHNEVSWTQDLAATGVGQTVYAATLYGSSITVRILAGSATTIEAMLIRVNT